MRIRRMRQHVHIIDLLNVAQSIIFIIDKATDVCNNNYVAVCGSTFSTKNSYHVARWTLPYVFCIHLVARSHLDLTCLHQREALISYSAFS